MKARKFSHQKTLRHAVKRQGDFQHRTLIYMFIIIIILLFYFNNRIKLNMKQLVLGISLLQLLIWVSFISSVKEVEGDFYNRQSFGPMLQFRSAYVFSEYGIQDISALELGTSVEVGGMNMTLCTEVSTNHALG